ncbi:MAG: hypothetical protein IT375_03130 [Polyangiaceae bacterium]|nr:hypothetical protein [Polyangiaceae bacterium]
MRWVLLVVGALVGCGDNGGGGPPSAPMGTGGGGAQTGTGGASSGGSAGTASGGAGTGGSGGGPLGPNCPGGTEGEIWLKLAGTHMLEAKAVAGGTEAFWTVGKTYAVDVNASDCSIVFHANTGQQGCKWTGNGSDYASETVKGITLTIHIQDGANWKESTANLCQMNYSIKDQQMGMSAFALPKSDTGAGFGPP